MAALVLGKAIMAEIIPYYIISEAIELELVPIAS